MDKTEPLRWTDHLLNRVISLLPHHLVSRIVLQLTRSEMPLVRNSVIGVYTRLFKLNLEEALEPSLSSYRSMNALFTRALKPTARPIDPDPQSLVSPADGNISEFGNIQGQQLLQAKGYYYDLNKLLGGDNTLAAPFREGQFATIYLSPRDYHRVHMPLTGTLTDMIYIPGRLFSVSPKTTRMVPEIFTRNERVACLFDTTFGRMAVILVGAINVAAIETVWAGLVTPPRHQQVVHTHYTDNITLQKGAEMGRFNMGSTAIVLIEGRNLDMDTALEPGQKMQMGVRLGCFRSPEKQI